MDDLGVELRSLLTEPALEPEPLAELTARAAGRRRRRRWAKAVIVGAATGLLMIAALPDLVGDGDRTVSATGRTAPGPIVSDPGGGITLRYLPAGFELVDDTASTRSRAITYAPDAARSSSLVLTRSASDFDLAGELAEQPQAKRTEVNGRVAVLVRPTQGAIVSWAPVAEHSVTLSVLSRSLPAEEVLRVARGISYEPSEDKLPPPPSGARGDGSDPIGAKTTVARGDAGATTWELVAYQSAAGLCTDLVVTGGGSGGGCSKEDLSGRALLGGRSGVRVPDGRIVEFVSGPVRKDVAQVRADFDAGPPLLLSPVGTDSGFGVNFYVSPVPECRVLTAIVALDASGRELDRLAFGPMPRRPGQAVTPTSCPPQPGR